MREPIHHPSDDEVLRRIRQGDHEAFGILVRRHGDMVYTLARRMLATVEDAEEAAQDAFVRAFRALPRFEQRARFSTWLYRITYNVCLSYIARTRRSAAVIPLEDEPMDEEVEDVGTRMDSEHLRDRIADVLPRMRAEYAAILTMFYVHDQSYEDIAAILECPLGTVKNRLHRARAALRAALGLVVPIEAHEDRAS